MGALLLPALCSLPVPSAPMELPAARPPASADQLAKAERAAVHAECAQRQAAMDALRAEAQAAHSERQLRVAMADLGRIDALLSQISHSRPAAHTGMVAGS